MTDFKILGTRAKEAKFELAKLSTEEKNKTLLAVAEGLIKDADEILKENAIDLKKGEENGMHPGLIDRLRLNEERIAGIAEGLRQICELDDPVGEIMEERTLYNDLLLQKRRVPMGVIGIIYESRPNVTADAFGLCFKTGNAVVLKGGSDAIHSNIAITKCIQKYLKECGINPYAIQIIEDTDRAVTAQFMKCKDFIDVLIPRGGAGLIKTVVENSIIPVIETGTGNCHIFIDETADKEMAKNIIFNAKTQRIGVCNSCESLVVHENVVREMMPAIVEALKEKDVEIRGDETVCEVIPSANAATEEDYFKEYLDYILSVKTVKDVEEAIKHINAHSTGHSEAIITQNKENAEKFMKEIDSACVYVNASTRFSDGFEFGMGAEIGISTQKLHARGPMGLKELTTYKYTVIGNGQIRG